MRKVILFSKAKKYWHVSPQQDNEHFLSGNGLLNKPNLRKKLSFISVRKFCSSLFNPNVQKTKTHALAVHVSPDVDLLNTQIY
ncbi:MAG: hypothetical protein ACI8Z9_000909 [Paraglaciecola sp.]|jgi:hypothetical protein